MMGQLGLMVVVRYGCRLVSFGETSMHSFYVAFLAVFFSGQAASQLFQFSTSMFSSHLKDEAVKTNVLVQV
jgi:hypothetical protein